ncbi:hypothetical protein CN485_04835 [Bacillus cereus]|nr:hypothetical protein CN485_04835 [Bacillus cereus]PEY99838.1 hypothetical protein CN349_14495 [Bacillus cereus]PGP71040.1 hypothetical protein CN998_03985 [Bacillus cereus]
MLYRNKEWLEREVSQGKSGAKIGREIGVSDTIINRWIKKFDLREKEENPYQDKEWLTREYITKNRRAKDIGAEFGVGEHTIWYWIRKHGLPKRSQTHQLDIDNMLYQNRDWLFEHFIILGETAKEIAEMFGVAEVTVVKWTKVFKLRKMDYRDMYVSVACSECDEEFPKLRTHYDSKIRAGRKNFYCGDECFKESRRRSIKAVNMYFVQERPETSIERKIRNVLEKLNINFRVQENILYWITDFYLPDYNLVIETNGDYWHANPEVYEPNELSERQQIRVRNDYFKINGLLNEGYKVLVLWEKDINERIDWCVGQIKETIWDATVS